MLWKIKLKGFIPFLIYHILLLTISYFLNRFLQMLIFVLFYEFIQNCFKYRFHADTIVADPIKAVRLCKVITIVVELVYLAFCNELDISLYSNLFVVFVIAFINCLLQFSIESFYSKDNCLKNKEILLELCSKANLSQSATNRMVLRYIENKTYDEIADLECVDVDSIKRSISRSKAKIIKG